MSARFVDLPFAPASADTGEREGRWVREGIREFGSSVSALLPDSLPGYARILHPAWREVHGTARQVSWAEVAGANGRKAHRLMQWPGITGIGDLDQWQLGQAKVYDEEPLLGSLPTEVARPLVEILAKHTETPESCLFGLWHGYGGALQQLPRDAEIELPHRKLWLYQARVQDATASFTDGSGPEHQSANLWWPSDQAWCVATDIDLASSYVGGSAELIAALLDSPDLEAVDAYLADPIHLRADTVNPYPEL
ncbi:hypothetical protein EV191_103236 [Tamaricihabitans halophyticus]|uniref:Uncharacterized protein n=1 Tax=Tamaricihabitans halophyticus TaxID=1262583 RepID=A0A4R2QVU3_9PSEU|nr:hypothetical protein [Tamaricihabitans halophyticus]TCP54193.1 hypothetical protein EV191_103236 [Tamaricihabitans halophyticus]